MEVDLGAAAARRPDFLQRTDRLALFEAHLPLRPVTFDGRDEIFRQCVHDARADAVQAPGGFVAAVLELSARVQYGEDHFQRASLRIVLVDRNPTTIVFNRDRRSLGVKGDPDIRGEAVHRLVD